MKPTKIWVRTLKVRKGIPAPLVTPVIVIIFRQASDVTMKTVLITKLPADQLVSMPYIPMVYRMESLYTVTWIQTKVVGLYVFFSLEGDLI